MTKKRQILFSVIRGLLAILIALLVATLLIFLSADGGSFGAKLSATGDALKQLLVGPLFRMGRSGAAFDFKRLTDILASMIPIIFTGLSVCVMFSANQFNLGAEGGIMLGAFTTGMVAVYVPMAAFLHPVVGVLAGGLAVAAIMLLPALLKTKQRKTAQAGNSGRGSAATGGSGTDRIGFSDCGRRVEQAGQKSGTPGA